MRITRSENYGNYFCSTEIEFDAEKETEVAKIFFDKSFEPRILTELKEAEQIDTTAQE